VGRLALTSLLELLFTGHTMNVFRDSTNKEFLGFIKEMD